MSPRPEGHTSPVREGGLTRYFVEQRQVGWLILVAVLLWGVFAYRQLPQQEDPDLPRRIARIVTILPGASAEDVERLVTRPLEQRIAALGSMMELSSESRANVSIINLGQQPASAPRIEQEWDRLRAALATVALPPDCRPPELLTEFGEISTMLLAITSQPWTEADAAPLARAIRERRRQSLTAAGGEAGRALVLWFPEHVAISYREAISRRFTQFCGALQIPVASRDEDASQWLIAEFPSAFSREQLEESARRFTDSVGGPDEMLHPDLPRPLVLDRDEDPTPQMLAAHVSRLSYRQLEDAVAKLQQELQQLPSVGRMEKIGAVREVLYLHLMPAELHRHQIPAERVIEFLRSNQQLLPGGTLRGKGTLEPLQIRGGFSDESAMLDSIVGMSEVGRPVHLREVAELRREYEAPLPLSVATWERGSAGLQRSVLLSVEMRKGRNIDHFGRDVRAAMATVQSRLPAGAGILTISDQPAIVQSRLAQFARCFGEAVLVVIAVSLLFMEWRAAAVVAAAIPLTIALTVTAMHLCGIPLHQISIAALIIALGILVDDPIVAADGINREIAAGTPRAIAAWRGPFRLRRPILFATLINVFAFLPLVLLPGDKKSFISALPIVVTFALIASRVVSMTFVPLLGAHLLQGQAGYESARGGSRPFPLSIVDRGMSALLPLYRRLLEFALGRPFLTVVTAYALLAASLLLVPRIGQQFFPAAERRQFIVDVTLPSTATVTETRRVCGKVAALLQSEREIRSGVGFMGGSGPRFYYNVTPKVPAEHIAQFIVQTETTHDVPALVNRLRTQLDREITEARCVVRQLEQGPPMETPVQIRVSGDDLDQLRDVADAISARLREAGAYHVHDDLGERTPIREVVLDHDRMAALGVLAPQAGLLIRAATADVPITELRQPDASIEVRLRVPPDALGDAAAFEALPIQSTRQQLVPLSKVATVQRADAFLSIGHERLKRTVTVKAYAPSGELASAVIARAAPEIAKIERSSGTAIEYAGEARELEQSRDEMLRVLVISLTLIALAIVMQFHSVAKSLTVMLVVPLGLIGALAGLALFRAPLGFIAMLAIVSLAGVIVSHVIVLSDCVEEARSRGVAVRNALIQASLTRLRPVLVTVLSTAGGLVPLALTGGDLWRPLTAVHIVGLLVATLLTLAILPALYLLLERDRPAATPPVSA